MFARFLHRPALAIVISLLILLMGGLSIKMLPISQFPEVAPPTVLVRVSYPRRQRQGPRRLDDMVILEQAINGVPGMRYMASERHQRGRRRDHDRVRAWYGRQRERDAGEQQGSRGQKPRA